MVPGASASMDQRNEEFHQWRLRTIDTLPELAAKVFSAKPRNHKLEHDFGFAVWKLTDFDDGQFYDGLTSLAKQSALRVTIENLHAQLTENTDETPGST